MEILIFTFMAVKDLMLYGFGYIKLGGLVILLIIIAKLTLERR